MAVGDSNVSESLVVLGHLFTHLDLFNKHCWGAPLIHARLRKVIFRSKVALSLRFAFNASWKGVLDNRELLLVGNHLRGVAPRIPVVPVVPVVPLSVVPDVGTALACCGYGGSIRSRLLLSSMQKKEKSVPKLFSFVSHVCLSFKTVVDNVPILASGVALGSPPLGLHEVSQPLAASPWLANSVFENKFKYEVGRDGAHGKQWQGALQDGRRLTWRSFAVCNCAKSQRVSHT